MNSEQLVPTLLALGLIPWHISRHWVSYGHKRRAGWRIYATFWRLTIDPTPKGHRNWRFTVPLIQRLSSAIWAAVKDLVKK